MAERKITQPQRDILTEFLSAARHGDGWLTRDASRSWRAAPMAIYSLRDKGLLILNRKLSPVRGWIAAAKLTPDGRERAEALE